MTDAEILAQAARTWSELERILVEQSPLSIDSLDVARAGCIAVIVDVLRGNREIAPAELYEPEPEPKLPLIEFPQIDRRPVSWWKNATGEGEDAPKPEPFRHREVSLAHKLSIDDAERWNKHLDAAVRGYSGDDSVGYEDK